MTYFRFEATDEYHNASTTKEFEAEQLNEILEEFQFFLKGIGFGFSGNLGILPEETLSFDHCGSWGFEDISQTGGDVDFDYIYNEPIYNPNLGGFKTSEGL
jgi:hypothetical protein